MNRPEERTDWEASDLAELVRHVLDSHHAFTRDRLATLPALASKVVAAHGDRDPATHEIAARLGDLRDELLPHMSKEEIVLFPYGLALQRSVDRNEPIALPHFGSAANPVRMMMRDHRQTDETLRALRSAARDYRVPDHACSTYRKLLAGLEELERDLVLHMEFENAVLFPRLVEVERRALG